MEATLDIKKKTDIFRQKTPEFFQKLYEFSFILRNFPNNWAFFVEFSYKTKNFPKYFRNSQKNSRYFPKELKDLKKTQSFGGNVPQVASQKPGQA